MAQGTIPKSSQDLSELVQLITKLNNGELDAMTLLEMKTLLVSYGFAEPAYMYNLNLIRVSHVSFIDSQPVVILKGGMLIKFGATITQVAAADVERRLRRTCDLWCAIVGKTNTFEVAIGAIDSAWKDGELERGELDAMVRWMGFAPAQLLSDERLVSIQVINGEPPSVGFLVTDKVAFLYRCLPELPDGEPSTPAYREAFGKEATFEELDSAIAELEKQL